MFDEPVVPKRPARKERPRKQQHHEAAQLDADQEGFEGCPQGLIDLSNDLLESTANPDHRADSFARLGMAMPGTLVSDHMAMPSDSMAMPSDPMAMDVASHDSRTNNNIYVYIHILLYLHLYPYPYPYPYPYLYRTISIS